MKLELEGREPLIVLFGLPLVTAAIVLGSIYLGRLQVEATPAPPIYLEPKLTINPRITAEMPQGAIRNEVQIPPTQIHEVLREVRAPDVHVINKVDPTPVQVVMQKTPGAQPQVVVLPTPLPLPMSGPGTVAQRSPLQTAPKATPVAESPVHTPHTTVITKALTAPPTQNTVVAPSETAQPNEVPPPPPQQVKPTPVSTDAHAEPEVEGKLLPPPRNLNAQPAAK